MSSSFSNYDEVVSQLTDFGLEVNGIDLGRVCRVNMADDQSRKRTGWYCIHELRTSSGEVLLVGAFGDWREGADPSTGRPVSHKISIQSQKLTGDELAAIKKRIAEDKRKAEARRKALQQRAADRARAAWEKFDIDGESEYLKRKHVQGIGVRYSSKGNLVIPMRDAFGALHGLQVIYSDEETKKKKRRDKDFWPAGLAKRGHFHMLGAIVADIALVAEGYATAASIHETTGLPVAVAFDAGNLRPVAENLKKRYPHVRILICADDDFKTEGNPGITAASSAALAVGGAWVSPLFSERGDRKLTDFNDLAVTDGPHAVGLQIRDKLDALSWEVSTGSAARNHAGGEGDDGIIRPIQTYDELHQRFVLIYGHNSTVYDRQERMLLRLGDMRDACTSKDIHRRWMESPDRAVARVCEVGFDPAEKDQAISCNLFGGWPTSPRSGSCQRLLEVLEYLCMDEEKPQEIYEWILKWLAYPIQHPGAKMRSALVLHGPQGVGKNLFFESVMAIYGEYGRVIDQAAIEDKFNDWASKKLFLIADEVVARMELYHVKNKLKSLITSDWIRINPKNLAAHEERNHVNLVFLSNETQPLVLERDDRRYCVIWTPPKLPPDTYKEIKAEIDAGGIEALHDYLLNLDLGNFTEYAHPPMTRAKGDLIGISMDSTERFWRDWLDGKIEGVPVVPCKSKDLYAFYAEYCKSIGYYRYAPEPKLLAELGKRADATRKVSRYMNGSGQRQATFIFPPGVEKPLEKNQSIWLSDCIEQFRTGVDDWKSDKTQDSSF
jgi:putative DNA primase/helicase